MLEHKKTSHTAVQENLEVSPFPAGDHKTARNRHVNKTDKRKRQIKQMIHKRSTHLERSAKELLEGLNIFDGTNLSFSDFGSRQIDVRFTWKIPNLSIYYLLVHTNQISKLLRLREVFFHRCLLSYDKYGHHAHIRNNPLYKSSSLEPKDQWSWDLLGGIWDVGPSKFAQKMILGWPWPTLSFFYCKIQNYYTC